MIRLAAHRAEKHFGELTLFSGVSFDVGERDRIGLVGANGCGKTTLFRLITGEMRPDAGEIVLPRETRIGYMEQHVCADSHRTLWDEVESVFAPLKEAERELEEINVLLEGPQAGDAALIERQHGLQERLTAEGGLYYRSRVRSALLGLGFDEAAFQQPVSSLSGGQRSKAAMARLLLSDNNLLLLDEPTNHLDAESILWLEEHLRQYKGTVIAVTHDRYFLDNVAGWILELDRGEGIPWKGNYSSWLDQKMQRLAKEEKQASKRAKTLQRELDWVRQNPKGRQAKSKARLSSYERLLNEDQKEKEEKLEIYIPNGPRLGTNVIEAMHVSKAFGDKLLYDDLNFRLPQNGIVGIIGPNGAGKTTIFKMIMGQEQPDGGTFEVGETVKIGYVDQTHSGLDPKKSIWENFSGGQELVMMGGRQVNSRAYLSRFNFSGTEQNKLVGEMSGGERNRLHLAITLKEEGNVLLLDEPTNDLDVNTLRALEEGLDNFAGCAVIISHDRWFLDRVCTHILAFEGDSQVYFFEGSFSEYEENKKKRLGDTTPTRIRYKKLVR